MLREWPTKGGPFLVGFSYWGTHIANVCHLCWSRCGTNRMKLEFNTSHLYLAFRGFLRIYHAVISCNKWPNITKLFSPKGIPRLIIPYCTTWWSPIIRCYKWGCRPNNYSYINIYHVYIPHQTKCQTSCVPCNSSAFLKWLNGSLSPACAAYGLMTPTSSPFSPCAPALPEAMDWLKEKWNVPLEMEDSWNIMNLNWL